MSILPEKHVRTAESLIGIGALVLLSVGGRPKTLNAVWDDLKKTDAIQARLHGSVSLDTVVLAIDFLFCIGALRLNDNGQLEHASN